MRFLLTMVSPFLFGLLAQAHAKDDLKCIDCHSDKAEGKVVHAPVKSWGCFVCHQKDTKGKAKPKDGMPDDHPRLLPIDTGNLDGVCLRCHDKVSASLKKAKVKHPAIDMGCTSCHQPHSSNYAHLLKDKTQDLCITCHDAIKPFLTAKVPHDPVSNEKACLNCHNGHVSAEKSLLRKPVADLCLDCHSKEQKNKKGETVINMKAYLDANSEQHAPVAAGDCTSCHGPHGSNEQGMLTKSFPADFYTSFSEKKYELCFSCHSASLVTAATTKDATTFRNGEKNLHNLHVKAVRHSMTCRACHEIHAGKQPKMIKRWSEYRGVKIPILFQGTENGGSCTTACHGQKSYDREKAVVNRPGR